MFTASKTTKIPVRWTAPEAALYQRFSVKSDVWSFGVLLYEMMSRGKMPYDGKTNKEVMEALSSGYRLACPNHCPPNIYRIMLECWNNEASKRPSFHALHSQLDNIYSRLYFKTIEVWRCGQKYEQRNDLHGQKCTYDRLSFWMLVLMKLCAMVNACLRG